MTAPSADVTITLTTDEALVLFAFLQRFSNTDTLSIEDGAEQRALWNLCCIFEKQVSFPSDTGYSDMLEAARLRLRDE